MFYNIMQVKHKKTLYINVQPFEQVIHVLWTNNYEANLILEVQAKQLPLHNGSSHKEMTLV
jgi:hypothetical protein